MTIIEFHKIWIEQYGGARGIKEEFGTEKALGYLIGEKLVNFVRAADKHPEFARELPNFAAEVKRVVEPWEVRECLEKIRRGAFGHVCTDGEVEMFRAAGTIHEDPVRGAEDVLIVEWIKELLLD